MTPFAAKLTAEYERIEELRFYCGIYEVMQSKEAEEAEDACPYELGFLLGEDAEIDTIIMYAAGGDPATYAKFCEEMPIGRAYEIYGMMAWWNRAWEKGPKNADDRTQN